MKRSLFVRFRIGVVSLAVALGLSAARAGQDDKKADKKIDAKQLNEKVKEIAGSAEFLGSVPKHFATLKAIDLANNRVTLLVEGEVLPKVWPLIADAEIKVMGWWGRLGDFRLGDRVWVWFKTDRKKQAVAVAMLADEISQQDINGTPLVVKNFTAVIKPKPGDPPDQAEFEYAKGKTRVLSIGRGRLTVDSKWFVQSAGPAARLILSEDDLKQEREKQKARLRERWSKDGLPGTIGFVHVFSGEMDLVLDHETMRWARSLQLGDAVTLQASPSIKALVKSVQPWRERTMLRLVVKSQELADLASGQRIQLLRTPPATEVDSAVLPPDIDRPRAGKQERIEWFLASIYCTCGVKGDRCTGHFYTLASCNPNACGMPKYMRTILARKIDEGKSDRQIFEELVKDQGPDLLRPHLLPAGK